MSECLRLQTVVLLLIHYEKTTVEEILSQMENFAVLFQSQMAEAVDHFSYDRIRSLQKLKQEIPDDPVQSICDGRAVCGGGIKRTSCIQPEHDGIFLGKSVIRK